MTTKKKPRPRAGVTPERIVDEAVALVDEHGHSGLSLGVIADALGVKTPSLYSHVDSLEHVERLLRVRAMRALLEKMQRSAVGLSRRDALLALADAQREFAKEHPGLWACTAKIGSDDLPEAHAAAREILNVVAAVIRGYGLTGDDALHATRALRATTRGFIDLETGGGFGMPLEIDESWRRLISLLDAGLASSSKS
jgi:AcrR family transcriptional regulator